MTDDLFSHPRQRFNRVLEQGNMDSILAFVQQPSFSWEEISSPKSGRGRGLFEHLFEAPTYDKERAQGVLELLIGHGLEPHKDESFLRVFHRQPCQDRHLDLCEVLQHHPHLLLPCVAKLVLLEKEHLVPLERLQPFLPTLLDTPIPSEHGPLFLHELMWKKASLYDDVDTWYNDNIHVLEIDAGKNLPHIYDVTLAYLKHTKGRLSPQVLENMEQALRDVNEMPAKQHLQECVAALKAHAEHNLLMGHASLKPLPMVGRKL